MTKFTLSLVLNSSVSAHSGAFLKDTVLVNIQAGFSSEKSLKELNNNKKHIRFIENVIMHLAKKKILHQGFLCSTGEFEV